MLTSNDRRKLRAAAARGAKRLDKMVRGWHRHVRLRELDMSSGEYEPDEVCGCVLAQVGDGHYEQGLALLGIELFGEESEEERLGFASYEDGSDLTYALLDEAWKDEIRSRRRGIVGARPA